MDPFTFNLTRPVPEPGYHWINGRRAGSRAGGKPERFLVPAQAPSSPENQTAAPPLEEQPALFLVLASPGLFTDDGKLGFANRFGWLGRDVDIVPTGASGAARGAAIRGE